MKAIFQREIKSHFSNMSACIFMAVMLAVVGFFSTYYNFKLGYSSVSLVLYGTSFIFLVMIPFLTMRSFAMERQEKTVNLLYSLPLKMSSIVLGKYFAMVCVFLVPILFVCIYPLILSMFGAVNFLLDYTSILAFFLLGCALIAIGMFISSLVNSQVIAAITGFAALLFVYLLPDISAMIPSNEIVSAFCFSVLIVALGFIIYSMTANRFLSVICALALEAVLWIVYFINGGIFESLFCDMLEAISLFSILSPFVEGMFDIGGIFFYLSVSCIFVFLTVISLEKNRYC